MTVGYSNTINLFFLRNGLKDSPIDMSEKSFERGLKQLIGKAYLYPEVPNQYWLNCSIF